MDQHVARLAAYEALATIRETLADADDAEFHAMYAKLVEIIGQREPHALWDACELWLTDRIAATAEPQSSTVVDPGQP